LGYDGRALPAQAVVAWIVLPVCYFFTPKGLDVNWVFGLFDQEQKWMPAGLYLGLTMAGYVLLLYIPTHLLLCRTIRPPLGVRQEDANANGVGRKGDDA